MKDLTFELERALRLPRRQQLRALRDLRARLEPSAGEDWNTEFAADSLYEEWSQLPFMVDLYRGNAERIRAQLDGVGPGWRAIEVGGGNGRLWATTLREDDRGELYLVDPLPGVHEVIRSILPPGVGLTSRVSPIEDSMDLPDADVLVCSLTLHHVAGRDADERRRHGLPGPGKLEVLSAFRQALTARGGIGLLNEADVHCEVDLPPGSETLANNIVDSYLRRAACAILADTNKVDDPVRRRRREVLVRRWCLDQLDVIDCDINRRDVYELCVHDWLELFQRADMEVRAHDFSDDWLLFHRYEFSGT